MRSFNRTMIFSNHDCLHLCYTLLVVFIFYVVIADVGCLCLAVTIMLQRIYRFRITNLNTLKPNHVYLHPIRNSYIYCCDRAKRLQISCNC